MARTEQRLLARLLWQDLPPVTLLAAPPMTAKLLPPQSSPPKTRLTLVSHKPNKITDTDEWFNRNGLFRPSRNRENLDSGLLGNQTNDLARMYEGSPLLDVYAHEDMNTVLAVYGKDYSDRRYLVSWNKTRKTVGYILDFGKWTGKNGLQGVEYAAEDYGTLYVSNNAGGYAKEAGGKNAYLTALEPKTGKLLWRSAPLSANAHNFLVLPDAIVCGYGFTAEPDFLYVLDKKTGRIVQTIRLKTGPEYILRGQDRVYVRCYNTDYVFDIK